MKIMDRNEKGQVLAPETKKLTSDNFKNNNNTTVTWLGNGGAMINSRGTIIMIDPLLEGFDMPLLREAPIKPKEVIKCHGVLISHCDNDHFSRVSCLGMKDVTKEFHGTKYVAELMREIGIDGIGHEINEEFNIENIKVKLTPADHAWQNEVDKYKKIRHWKKEEYCGFIIETEDGDIWYPGDSRLIEEQLALKEPKVILFDFSDNLWHITLEGAIKLANNYPNSILIPIHYGCVDAAEMNPFNGNPEELFDKVVNPERIFILGPGEILEL